ncbi:biopolymer transport protein [Flammeovirgaceae bacterium 311]|nr:biopolymer transport protein [Flammeovirgaceae bacterium 311]
MFDLFIEGGWLFMSLITLLALAMLFFAAKGASLVYGKGVVPTPGSLYYIRFFGMLALVTGILGQLIGLYEAMKMISKMGEVSQQILAGGIKVSSITTLYGFLVFLIAHFIWFALDMKAGSLATTVERR